MPRPLELVAIAQGLVMTAIIVAHGAPLTGELTPLGIVSLELAATAERATVMIEAWRVAGVLDVARQNMWLDFIYLLSYPLALSVALRALWLRSKMARLIWLAAPLDLVENLILLRAIDAQIDGWMLPAAICATIKLSLVASALMAALWMAFTRARRSVARRRAA